MLTVNEANFFIEIYKYDSFMFSVEVETSNDYIMPGFSNLGMKQSVKKAPKMISTFYLQISRP